MSGLWVSLEIVPQTEIRLNLSGYCDWRRIRVIQQKVLVITPIRHKLQPSGTAEPCITCRIYRHIETNAETNVKNLRLRSELTEKQYVDAEIGNPLSDLHDRNRETNPSQMLTASFARLVRLTRQILEGLVDQLWIHPVSHRLAESRIYVKQNADRRIPPGRNPGSSGARE